MIYETKSATTAGAPLAYLTAGVGEPLLVAHTSGGALWTPLLDLIAQTRQVFLPVLPGFGLTPMREGVASIADLADLLASFITEVIGAESVDVFGGSFGGQVTLYLAARHPALVGRLLLEAPAGVAVGADPAKQEPEARRKGLFAHPEKAAAFRPTPELAAGNGAAFRAYGGPILVDETLVTLLPKIDAHTLVVMGTLDRVTPPEAGQYLASVMPHVNLTYVYDAAHAVQVDQPEAMYRVARHFLDKGPAFVVASREYA
jgi:pimeloyl-ACP methyl ester carboxylesterase